ncbi:TonB system transport protein ExbD [Paracoccus aurantiacus]|uniref:Biopolymer transport protein ExbD n=1 Tax=Paracoccus aurantiacus TaxID=2599412 RepID=A0A5C6SC47_9RHOB|nr:TonB system transport protein ExbD [Paracoccus aurantiacus]TXB71175.1 TonB system transport protein ExbD [Paracoccus aurantiacus]
MAGGIQDDDALVENHEINVTPFIDVMLVLLIIFMVAAPLATVDINVDLPASRGVASQRTDDPVWLTLSGDGAIALGNDVVARDNVIASIDAQTGGDHEARIYLRADRQASYGDVMEVMNLLRDAAYTKIALVGLDAATTGDVAADAADPVQ